MKHLLITTIAAALLVGCGESQPPTTDYVDPRVANYDPNKSWGLSEEEKAAEEAAQKAQAEPLTVEAPDISLFDAADRGNIEAVKQHIAAGADVNAKTGDGRTPLDHAEFSSDDFAYSRDIEVAKKETADLLRKHGGKTSEELKAEEK